MNFDQLLDDFKNGALSRDELKRVILRETFLSSCDAALDSHRALRKNHPEVVYCAGKTPDQAAAIFTRMAGHLKRILGTRATAEQYERLRRDLPVRFDPVSRLLTYEAEPVAAKGKVAVVSAGTSDLPVAEEAAQTAEFLGSAVQRCFDRGVAGIHRLFAALEELCDANCVIAVAGMDGALPSVLGGVVAAPVIAVPTSIGYGASFGGVAALLTMLNSCAPGVAVVNIDNGFGAGYLAHVISTRTGRE
jgi:NCAIR mutase (PurE)-related protein